MPILQVSLVSWRYLLPTLLDIVSKLKNYNATFDTQLRSKRTNTVKETFKYKVRTLFLFTLHRKSNTT